MQDPARDPQTPDEELLEAETAAIAHLYTDADRVERMAGELKAGFAALSGLPHAVSVFGSARTARDDPQYQAARDVARRLGEEGYAIITGGGPGIMEAANHGAADAGVQSVGLGIDLPLEPGLNDWVDAPLQLHYFFTRKVMFVRYASAFVVFPGGFGTLDELFEAATLRQTGKVRWFPIVLFGSDYWDGLVRWLDDPVRSEGKISDEDWQHDRGHRRPRAGRGDHAEQSGPVGDAVPGRLGGELDELAAALGLGVAEGCRVLVEHQLQLALHDPLVQPGAAEDQPPQPVHQRAVRMAVQVAPAVHHVLAQR